MKDMELCYGYRGTDPRLHHMSVFDLMRFVDVVQPELPKNTDDAEKKAYRVELTPEGLQKLSSGNEFMLQPEPAPLVGGTDYVIKEDGGTCWLPFPDIQETRSFRHDWVMEFRRRPSVPTFISSPMPKTGQQHLERNAMLLMAYFHPWTLIAADDNDASCPEVRHSVPSTLDILGTKLAR